MTEAVVKHLEYPLCCTNRCAMWRWSIIEKEITDWISWEEGKKLEKEGWVHVINNGASGHRYSRPFPKGQRPRYCGLINQGQQHA